MTAPHMLVAQSHRLLSCTWTTSQESKGAQSVPQFTQGRDAVAIYALRACTVNVADAVPVWKGRTKLSTWSQSGTPAQLNAHKPA